MRKGNSDMLIFEVQKDNEEYLDILKQYFPGCIVREVNELGMEGFFEVLVTVFEKGWPALSAIIVQCVVNKKATVKINNGNGPIEITGSQKFVERQLKLLIDKKILEADIDGE